MDELKRIIKEKQPTTLQHQHAFKLSQYSLKGTWGCTSFWI